MDNAPIGQMALTIYQAAIAPLPRDPLGVIPNCRLFNENEIVWNGTKVIENLSLSYLYEDLYTWDQYVNGTQPYYQSDYEITFGCIVDLVLRLTLPSNIVDQLLPFLVDLFGLPEDDAYFLESIYDPQLKSTLEEAGVDLNEEDKTTLLRRFTGTLLKLMYAFLWQENFFPGPWLESPEANQIGL